VLYPHSERVSEPATPKRQIFTTLTPRRITEYDSALSRGSSREVMRSEITSTTRITNAVAPITNSNVINRSR